MMEAEQARGMCNTEDVTFFYCFIFHWVSIICYYGYLGYFMSSNYTRVIRNYRIIQCKVFDKRGQKELFIILFQQMILCLSLIHI